MHVTFFSGSDWCELLIRTELEWNVDPQPMSDRCTIGALWTLRWKLQGMLIRCIYQRGNDIFTRRVLGAIGGFVACKPGERRGMFPQ
jgi:hypothetical protein